MIRIALALLGMIAASTAALANDARPGGIADTLLALVWTQYQYFFFPMIMGAMGVALLREDWRSAGVTGDSTPA